MRTATVAGYQHLITLSHVPNIPVYPPYCFPHLSLFRPLLVLRAFQGRSDHAFLDLCRLRTIKLNTFSALENKKQRCNWSESKGNESWVLKSTINEDIVTVQLTSLVEPYVRRWCPGTWLRKRSRFSTSTRKPKGLKESLRRFKNCAKERWASLLTEVILLFLARVLSWLLPHIAANAISNLFVYMPLTA